MKNASGQVQDRTTTSLIEDYLDGLPSGTWATRKMIQMHLTHPISTSRIAAFMSYLTSRGVCEAMVSPMDKVLVWRGLRGKDNRSSKHLFAKRQEGRTLKEKHYVTKTGVELAPLAPCPPPPTEVPVLNPTHEEVKAALGLLMLEFGLTLWYVDGNLTLKGA